MMKNNKLEQVANAIWFCMFIFAVLSNMIIGFIEQNAYNISVATLFLVLNNSHFDWD